MAQCQVGALVQKRVDQAVEAVPPSGQADHRTVITERRDSAVELAAS